MKRLSVRFVSQIRIFSLICLQSPTLINLFVSFYLCSDVAQEKEENVLFVAQCYQIRNNWVFSNKRNSCFDVSCRMNFIDKLCSKCEHRILLLPADSRGYYTGRIFCPFGIYREERRWEVDQVNTLNLTRNSMFVLLPSCPSDTLHIPTWTRKKIRISCNFQITIVV